MRRGAGAAVMGIGLLVATSVGAAQEIPPLPPPGAIETAPAEVPESESVAYPDAPPQSDDAKRGCGHDCGGASCRRCRLSDRLDQIFAPHEIGPCGRWGTLDVGGQIRLRCHHEQGMGQQAGATRFQATQNDFLLTRLRVFADWQANDWLRVYAEGLYADVWAEPNYVPRIIDENDFDAQNLYADLKLTDCLTLRVGRQELLYGEQRLVSPLDWANTRRTFEGAKIMYRNDDWAVDGFFTNFVPPNPGGFDRPEYDISLYGVYATRTMGDHVLDLYYLGTDNQLTGGPPATTDYSLHTFGGRIYGEHGCWLYELEGGGQFGRQSGLGVNQSANFVTAGLGHKFCCPGDPTLWFYYDYASGDVPGGDFNRFNDLFPLGHKYLGFIDAVLRRNVQAPNVLFTFKPTKKTKALLWYYHFLADEDEDIIQSIGGTPAQLGDERHFGDELDVILSYQICEKSDILFGWSHFWAGEKIVDGRDADFFYTQWQYHF